jgi:hypothetical protein
VYKTKSSIPQSIAEGNDRQKKIHKLLYCYIRINFRESAYELVTARDGMDGNVKPKRRGHSSSELDSQ